MYKINITKFVIKQMYKTITAQNNVKNWINVFKIKYYNILILF